MKEAILFISLSNTVPAPFFQEKKDQLEVTDKQL